MRKEFKWGDLVAMMRCIARGPNYLLVAVSDNPVDSDIAWPILSIYVDESDYWSGIGLYRTQNAEYILRRFLWQIAEDRELFRMTTNLDDEWGGQSPLQVQSDYWLLAQTEKGNVDSDVASIKDVLLKRANALDAELDFEAEFRSERKSAFSCAQISYGTGLLIQDGVDFCVYSDTYRSLVNRCNIKYCQAIDTTAVSESYYSKPKVGRPAEFSAWELTQLPHSLHD